MSDEQILEILAASFDDIGAVPADARQAAVDAFAFRDLDSRLAELTFDSWLEQAAVAMRGHRTDTRLLSFELDQVAIDIEFGGGAGTTLLGQVSPAGTGPVEIESPSGVTLTVTPDGEGRFRLLSVPNGSIRLRIAGGVRTPWIVR